MRTLGLTLSALMLTGLVAFGQATGCSAREGSAQRSAPTKAMSEKNQKYLDAYLKRVGRADGSVHQPGDQGCPDRDRRRPPEAKTV